MRRLKTIWHFFKKNRQLSKSTLRLHVLQIQMLAYKSSNAANLATNNNTYFTDLLELME